MQSFKQTDIQETKFNAVFDETLDLYNVDLDQFFEECFLSFLLGDILFDLKRDPMSGVITKVTFRESFPQIHDMFTRAGTFEFYLEVFNSIWGDDVEVTFSRPSAGVLEIDIEAVTAITEVFSSVKIENAQYVFTDVVDHEGDEILFQGYKGTKDQRELDALINELAPAGAFITATLIVTE